MKRWLEHASSTFATLEINGSFYTQIRPETYERWRRETPDDFVFSLKAHRYVTHYKRLREVEDSVERLRDQSSSLGDKLACVLWQLPARMRADEPRLEEFLGVLRSSWPAVRHAFEPRHASWFTPGIARALSRGEVAVAQSDAPDFPLWDAVTADFVYVRLHGHTRKYASSYNATSLRRWANDAKRWARSGRDVYVYFDNDAEGAAVKNALALAELVTSGCRAAA